MRLTYKSIKVRTADYNDIQLNKSKYEAKTGKKFSGMGEYLKEISGLLA